MKKAAFLIFAMIIASQASYAETSVSVPDLVQTEDLLHPTVMNGNLATDEDKQGKFVVRLDMLDANGVEKGKCTGIIIAKDMILTAGHCFSTENMQVKIGFGLGGEAGFKQSAVSREYISFYRKPSAPGTGPWANGLLAFDLSAQASFQEKILSRTELFNYFGSNEISDTGFYDLGIIKLPFLPKGYKPIKLFSGKINHGEKVFVIGYGFNQRVQGKNDFALRWSEAKLVGYYQRPNEVINGFEIFSPTNQQACYGDSGGPLIIQDGSKFKLLGINLFTFNKCANSNWYLNSQYHFQFINESMAKLRAQQSI